MRIVSGTAVATAGVQNRRLAPCRSLIATPRFRLDNALVGFGPAVVPVSFADQERRVKKLEM